MYNKKSSSFLDMTRERKAILVPSGRALRAHLAGKNM